MRHLILFDDTCGLCRSWVARIKRWDQTHLFSFKPFDTEQTSMVLIENEGSCDEKTWVRGRAAFRVFWLLGGKWKVLGLLCFLPVGVDQLYDLIARHRKAL